MKKTVRLMLVVATVLGFLPPAAAAQHLAPNRLAVVADVLRAHPEINACDEDSLDRGRAAIVDWAAQRLNKAEGRVVWGRKSRGRPTGDRAENPNTDGLTYLRPDGRFEIVDAIVGATCKENWENLGPFAPGENGYWAPPQLGPEPTPGGGTVTPPPPASGSVTRADLEAAIAPLVARLRALEQQLAEQHRNLRDVDERLSAQIDAVEPVDLVPLQAAFNAALSELVVVGKTRTAFGHQHDLGELKVVRKK